MNFKVFSDLGPRSENTIRSFRNGSGGVEKCLFFLLWLPPSSLLSPLHCPRPRPPSLQRHFFCIISFSSYSLTEVSDLLGFSGNQRGDAQKHTQSVTGQRKRKGKSREGSQWSFGSCSGISEPLEFRELLDTLTGPALTCCWWLRRLLPGR